MGHGRWLATLELLPFNASTASRLMAIARNPAISNDAHGHDLPSDIKTLAALASLPEGEVTSLIKAGEITPKTTRSQANWKHSTATSLGVRVSRRFRVQGLLGCLRVLGAGV